MSYGIIQNFLKRKILIEKLWDIFPNSTRGLKSKNYKIVNNFIKNHGATVVLTGET